MTVEGASALNRVRWSSGGKEVAVGDSEGRVWIYDTGEVVTHFCRQDLNQKKKEAQPPTVRVFTQLPAPPACILCAPPSPLWKAASTGLGRDRVPAGRPLHACALVASAPVRILTPVWSCAAKFSFFLLCGKLGRSWAEPVASAGWMLTEGQ